ncbi:collagen-binding domain-containing protein [Alteromonas hispanica]|uniref:Choice-of-anchor A family protein n=1 Tax=Alteromonas hispanica TaxID=315421 RepID=A0A6L9MX95_9ALTE|nr:collagen-binding domain-containing protein [Alteromonas hispanica]NDW22727.1 choice-of-anchor A family protein [Alteromonas hispanica]
MKKTSVHATAIVVGVLSFAPFAQAGKIELSRAFDYNAFIFEDFEGRYSDVEGRLAVGGNMTVNDFNVGLLLPPDLSTSSLAVGGDLNFTRGNVHGGDTTVSGSVTASNVTFDNAVNSESNVDIKNTTIQNGGILSEGDVYLDNSNISNGSIRAKNISLSGTPDDEGKFGSSVDSGSLLAESDVNLDHSNVGDSITYGGNLTAVNSDIGGQTLNEKPLFPEVENIDFQELIDEVTLQSKSFKEEFENAESIGTTLCNGGDCETAGTIHEIKFSGRNSVNYYSVQAEWLSAKDKKITYDFSTTSYNIINVFGDNVELFNTGFYNTAFVEENEYFREQGQYRDNNENWRHDGLYTNNILFNFVDATNIKFHSVGIKGSVLAPYAEIGFYNGHIDGNLIASSLVTPEVELENEKGETYLAPTGQVNDYRFGAINVSEPASVALLFGAGCLLINRRRKRLI